MAKYFLSSLFLTLYLLTSNPTWSHPPLQIDPIEDPLINKPGRPTIGGGDVGPLYKLNDAYIPSHYDIELTINLDNPYPGMDTSYNFTALGVVDITFQVRDDVDHVILHGDKLTEMEFKVK